MTLLFSVIFGIFPNLNCHVHFGLWKAGSDVVIKYVLQSYHSCTFCKRKTRGEAVLDISCSSVYICKSLWNKFRRHITIYHLLNTRVLRWLESPLASTLVAIAMFPLTSQTTVIRPLAGGKCRTFRWIIARFCFHRYFCFHCVFCVRGFLSILFFYEQSEHIVLKLYSF